MDDASDRNNSRRKSTSDRDDKKCDEKEKGRTEVFSQGKEETENREPYENTRIRDIIDTFWTSGASEILIPLHIHNC